MEANAPPTSCAVALKEWATVLEAMARGEQLLLIRKGGLIEPGSGFELAAPSFVFYPTFEHQASTYLRPPYQGYFEEAGQRRAPEGQVRVDLFGVAVSSTRSHDPAIVERVSAFHIYNDAFVSQRLTWQPDQPLMLVVVRAYRFPASLIVPVNPRYAGCKSCVDLETPISLVGSQPILDDARFEERLRELTSLLA